MKKFLSGINIPDPQYWWQVEALPTLTSSEVGIGAYSHDNKELGLPYRTYPCSTQIHESMHGISISFL
jgi:hypothetical protein